MPPSPLTVRVDTSKSQAVNCGSPLNSPILPPTHRDAAVKETSKIRINYNPVSGRKQLNTYEIIKELGRGEYGRVKLGYDRDLDMYVAIKLLNRKNKPRLGRPQSSTTEEMVHREIAILKKCCHPNIVQLLEVLDDESSRKIYLVLEYCAKGELEWQNKNGDGPKLSRQEARGVARNVALGIEYLHANGIIHRDIKPANLLISSSDVVKISDFGVSYAVSAEETGTELELAKTVGTPAFFAPELCVPTEFNEQGERMTPPVNEKVDVWAFGVTLYCLLYGVLPFEAENEYELFSVINSSSPFEKTPNHTSSESSPSGAVLDDDLVLANDLLQRLLIKDPAKRPSMSEAKQHPWFQKGLSMEEKQIFLQHCPSQSIKVSSEEVDEAVQGVSIRSMIRHGFSRIAEHMKPKSKSGNSSSTTLKTKSETFNNGSTIAANYTNSTSSANSTSNNTNNTVKPKTRLFQSRSFNATPALCTQSSKSSKSSKSSAHSKVQSEPSNATLRALDQQQPQAMDSQSSLDDPSHPPRNPIAYSHCSATPYLEDEESIISDTDHSLSSSHHETHIYYQSEADSLKPEYSNKSDRSRRSSKSSKSSKHPHIPHSPRHILHSKTSLDNSSFLGESSEGSSSDEELMIVVGRDRARSIVRDQQTLAS